jgi:hypothetical protein
MNSMPYILAMGFKVKLGGGFSKPIKNPNKNHKKTLNPNCLNRGVDGSVYGRQEIY